MPVDTTKLKDLWTKVKDFFKNMSNKVRIILAAALIVILIAIIVAVVVFRGDDPYTVLYQDMTPTEVSEIISYFQNNDIKDYQVNGTEISVRNDQYASLLAKLAQAGYPKDGTLYGSYWEHAGTMSTTSERTTAYLLARQEALETSIRTFDGVLNATVYITPGEDRTYVLEDISTQASASVKVDLKDNYVLPDEVANAIRLLVSRAWSGLEIDNVAITDNWGNTYEGQEVTADDAAELQNLLQERESNRLRTQIKKILDPFYGAENVQVGVTVMVEVNRIYRESQNYEQPEGSYDSGGLIGHELGTFALTRDGYTLVGGVPGTTTNSDIPTYVSNAANEVEDEDGVVTSWERENKIDTYLEQTEVLAPRITSIGIAVTILEDAYTLANFSVAELKTHVATVANIGGENPEDRVSVLIAPGPGIPVEVPEPVEGGFLSPDMMPYLIIIAVALLLIIIVLVVILSIRKKKREQEEEDQRLIEEQLNEMGAEGLLSELGIVPPEEMGVEGEMQPPTSGADIMDINTEKSMELRKALRQFVQNNPEVAALMLKNWLKGGDDENGGNHQS